MLKKTDTDADRLWHLFTRSRDTETQCLEFQGCIQANGYARATVRRQTDYAHRHAYRLAYGPIPAGLDVCHICDNRRCINPEHMFLGTRKDNMADAVCKGRQAKGFRLPQTKLTTEQRADIAARVAQGVHHAAIAAEFGISRPHVGYVARQEGVRRHVVA